MVLDDKSRIVDVNDNLLKLLNLSRQETTGKNVTYLNPPDVDVHELLDTFTSGTEEQGRAITFMLKKEGERIFTQKSVPTVFEDGKKGRTIILEEISPNIYLQIARSVKARNDSGDDGNHPGRYNHYGE